MLKLVRGSGSSEGDLANKAANILRSRLGKAKEVPSSADTGSASAILVSIHEMARTAPSADFSSLCSACSLFVARTLDPSQNTASEIYRATLADFMKRKTSAVHPSFILDYVRRFTVQAWQWRIDLCGYVAPGASVNSYRQIQAYAFLQTILQQLDAIVKAVGPEQVRDHVKRASGDVLDTLASAAGEGAGSNLNSTRLKAVVKFALGLARATRSPLIAEPSGELWDMQRLAKVTAAFKQGERTKEMKGVHALLQQLDAILGASVEKPKKSKTDKAKPNGQEQAMKVDAEVGQAELNSVSRRSIKSNGKEHKRERANGTDVDKHTAIVEESVVPVPDSQLNERVNSSSRVNGEVRKATKRKIGDGIGTKESGKDDPVTKKVSRKKHIASIGSS